MIETHGEKKLIEALREEARRMQYGEINMNITFSKGQIKKMELTSSQKNVLLD